MKPIFLNSETVLGAISLEKSGGLISPWRIFYDEKDFYTPNQLNGTAEIPAGVRITFETNSPIIKVELAASEVEVEFDLLIDRELVKTIIVSPKDTSFTVDGLLAKNKFVEIYLSQQHKVAVRDVYIAIDANWNSPNSLRKKWLAYGSSITQCHAAESPSKTWPAITAAELDLDLTCLGFSGQCQFEPMIARTIRDTPVNFISLCAGINIYGANSYNERTFQAIIIGFIKIIREKHTTVPIVLSSPIFGAFREETTNSAGFTLIEMRQQVQEIVEIFRRNGDNHLFYINGLDILGEKHAGLLPDQLHPNAEGYKMMGHNFANEFKEYFK
ncbi:G-D-S-L family lipolytic protein [Sporosarcina sp. ANT_H38]|uniref:SGNH/GDSL hydrolase family protein n=1 Tax=Sporosarcina sp. ANT_H38 TaxID=2597358 RepID=UPI0011F143B2|nr:SGNH/GDSL hydrolase family protein [Sporosarcina sp. ANT_H38]KAA0966187.1 G-D-S-L family lipolytic protein [Sporosarcina sp. ANT_H38]